MKKKDLIRDLRNNIYCRIKSSPIEGVGVFAIRDIPKGTRPLQEFTTGDFIEVDADEVYNDPLIHESVKQFIKDMYVQKDGKLYLYDQGLNAIPMSFLLNHSKDPNMIEISEGIDFEAARDIKAGEELTVDYDSYCDSETNEF